MGVKRFVLYNNRSRAVRAALAARAAGTPFPVGALDAALVSQDTPT